MFSGGGSEPESSKQYEDFVAALIERYGVRTMIDFGCGDFQVSKRILEQLSAPIQYLGVDVVASVIERNQRRFGSPTVRFELDDISTGQFARCDLICIRQVLQHHSNDSIQRILANAQSRCRLLVVAEHVPLDPREKNVDILTGHQNRLPLQSGVYIDHPPFGVWVDETISYPMPKHSLMRVTLSRQSRHRIELGEFKAQAKQRTVGADVSSSLKIDVVIPAAAKDHGILPFVVEGLQRNLRHPIGSIILIAQISDAMSALAQRMGCALVDENSLAPVRVSDISYIYKGKDRSGWLLQQLLKLAADKLTSQSHYFVIDADTMLTRPQVFELGGLPLLLHSDQHHEPYFDVCQKLTGFERATDLSCVAHMMLFDVDRLRALKAHIERRSSSAWYEAIVSNARFDSLSGFSEYELYGQWCLHQYPTQTLREYWFGMPLHRSKLSSVANLEQEYGDTYRAVACHAHLKR